MPSTTTATLTTRADATGHVTDILAIVTSWPDKPEWPDTTETLDAFGPFHTIEMMRRANMSGGYHFFDKDTMRFFRSRVAPGVSHGRVFITSEQNTSYSGYTYPRLYTVRAMKNDGSTTELSEFQQFATLRQARAYVRDIYGN